MKQCIECLDEHDGLEDLCENCIDGLTEMTNEGMDEE